MFETNDFYFNHEGVMKLDLLETYWKMAFYDFYVQ